MFYYNILDTYKQYIHSISLTLGLRLVSYLRGNSRQYYSKLMVWFMVFNTTFNNISTISWWSVFLVEETREPGENHTPVVSD